MNKFSRLSTQRTSTVLSAFLARLVGLRSYNFAFLPPLSKFQISDVGFRKFRISAILFMVLMSICSTNLFAQFSINPKVWSVPSSCNVADGVLEFITEYGHPLQTTLYFKKDGVSEQKTVTGRGHPTSYTRGIVTVTGLAAGTYSEFTLSGYGSIPDVVYMIAHNSPTITAGNATNPTTFSGTNGSIAFTSTNLPDGNHTISFTASSGATTGSQTVTVSGNAFSLTGLKSGTYSNFLITNTTTNCTGFVSTSKTLTAPTTCPPVATATEQMTWTGAVSTDWNNPCNWSPNGVPTATNSVSIPNVANDPVIMSSTIANAFRIDIGNNASLTINSGGELNVLPTDVLFGISAIYFSSNATLTNNGTLNATSTVNVPLIALRNDNTSFNNNGTANLNSPFRNIQMDGPNAMVNNSVSGIINFQSARGFNCLNGTAGNVITNQGTMNYTGYDFFAALNPGFTLNNSGTIDVKSGNGIIMQGGTINNLACGRILIPTTGYDNRFSGSTTNAGLIITAGINNTGGSFTNNGVLKYGSLSGTVTNNQAASVIVNNSLPIFTYGGTYDGTINGIFTNAAATTSAGTFTAPNTFVPSGLTCGSQTLYAKITPSGGACTYVVPFTYTPVAPTISVSSQTNVLCNGGTTGAFSFTVAGGTGAKTVVVKDAANNTIPTTGTAPYTVSGRAAGVYTISVTDAASCSASQNVILTQPSTPLSISTAKTNVTVNGGNNGKITVTASGGTGALQFSKNGGTTYTAGTSPFDFTALTAATYQIRVKDANGCETANSAVTITQPVAVSFTTTKTNILCNGALTGTIQVTVSAGTSPYQFSKDDGATFTTGTSPFTFSGLAAGTYKIKVKDNTGFITTAQSVTLTQPTPLSISTTDVDVTINGGSNGKITVTASGGTGALQFSKDGGTTYTAGTSPFDFTGLTAATYQIRVKDANGCETANSAVIISQPTAVSFTTTKTNILCNGASTGKIVVTVSAGTAPYQFSKDDGVTFTSGTTPFTFNSLAAATYKIKVKDQTGFVTAASSVTLTQPTVLNVSTAKTNVNINGGNNGTITVTASGGTGALQFSKDGGTTYVAGTSPFVFNNLTAATYQIRVKDANACQTANSAVTITQPTAATFTTTPTNILCNGASTGSIQVTVSAGTAPYQFSNDNGVTFTTGTTPFTFNGLAAASYKIKVKDNTGFITAATTVTLTQQTPLSMSTSETDVTVNGGNDGTITVTASGGTGALQFSKNGGTTYVAGTSPFNFTTLTAGDYDIRVKDANGCETAVSAVTITQPTAVSFKTTKTNILCNGASTGKIIVTVSTGTAPYEFSKDNGVTFTTGTNPFTFNGLAAAVYKIKVKDNTGFTTLASSVTLTQPTVLSISTTDADVTINGGNDGKITVTANGGTGALQFSKDGGTTYTAGTSPFVFNNLTASTYQIRVKDANNCETANSAVQITQPTAVSFTTAKTNILCNGASTGEIEVNVSAGTSPFEFSKDDGVTFTAGTNPLTFSGLAAATYKIKVKDQTGFVTTASSVTLTQPTPLSISSTSKTDVTVNGGNDGTITVTASGGTGALQFSKDGGTTYTTGTSPFVFNTLTAEDYDIRVKDANDCETAISAVTISQPSAVNFTAYKANIACNGASTGAIQVDVTNGTSPFQFSKDDGATFTTGTDPFIFNGLAAGTYKIKVKDQTGFITAASSVTLTQPSTPLSMSTSDIDVTINGGNDGKITVSAGGGTGSLRFSKSAGVSYISGTSPFVFNNLTAANYGIRVKDANGCETALYIVTISQPTAVNFTTAKTDIDCNGASTGEIEVNVSAGTSPFEFSKDDGVTFTAGTNPFTFNGLSAATYKIKVKDNTGFVTSATSVTLSEPTPLTITAGTPTNTTTCGGTDGTIPFTTNLPNGSYTISYTGGNGSQMVMVTSGAFTLTGLTAGTYSGFSVTVGGCTGIDNTSKTVSAPAAPTLSSPYQLSISNCGGSGRLDFNATNLSPTTTSLSVSFTATGANATPSPQTVSVTYFPSSGTYIFPLSLKAGTYSNFSFTHNGCTATYFGTQILTDPEPPTLINVNRINVLCHGGSTGQIAFTGTGGSSGSYSGYITNPANQRISLSGSSTFTASNLSAGVYTIEVERNGCYASQNVTVTEPNAPLSMSTSKMDVSINGGNNGKITVTAGGGTGALQFSKDGGTTYTAGTSPFEFTTLTAATYQIRVKDANACVSTVSTVTINQPTAVNFTTTPTNIACNGATTGAIQVNVTAGTSPFEFSKDDGATFTAGTNPFTFNGLAAGVYKIKVKDQTGFITSASSVTLTQPNLATATEDMTWTGTVSTDWNNACNWTPNGIPTATNSIAIPNVANDPVIMSGTTAYVFRIDIGNSASLTINSGAELNVLPTSVLFGISAIYFSGNATLTNNGILNANTTVNVPLIALANDNATFNNNGTANLNSPFRSVVMNAPNAMVNNSALGIINFQSGRGLNCINGTTGNVITNQGTMNYTGYDYFAALNPGFTLNNSGTIDIKSGSGIAMQGGTLNNLACAKILMPTAQFYDNRNSSVTTNAGLMITGGLQNTNGSFTNNGVLKYSSLSGNAIINNQNSSVIVNNTQPIFTYGGTFNGTINGIFKDATATTSAGTFTAPNTFTPSGLTCGANTLYAKITTMGGACSYIVAFTYTTVPPTVSITGLNSAYCKSASAVTLIGSPSGGSFTIDGTVATQLNPSVLSVGNRTVVYTYSDGNGCGNIASQTVAINALPTVSITGLNAAYCKSASAVALTGSPSGGSFTIDGTVATQLNPSVLSVGNRTVVYTYSDGNGCGNTASQTVTINALPIVSITGLNATYCKSASAFTLTGSPTGGSFTVDGISGTSFDPSALSVGNHTVVYTYTDGNGCRNTATSQVTLPTLVAFVGNPSVTNANCTNGSDGQVVVSANGGTGAISYSINPNTGNQSPVGTFNGLTARAYTITATDANSCIATTTATVGTRGNIRPSVTLTSPTNGAIFVTNAMLTVIASDADGSIARVNYYMVVYGDKAPLSRTLLGSSTTAPYSFDWRNIVGGHYNIQAEAMDNCGNVTFSSVAQIMVLETCTVLITSPTTGQGFVPGSNLTLAASVVSFTNRTITKVEFYKDNVKLGEDLTAPYTYSWMNVPSGSYYLRAVATDNSGGVWYSPYTYILGINPSNRNTATQTSTSTVFTLFPNPTNSQVNLRTTISEEGNYNINIMDMMGRIVVAKQNNYAKGDLTESLDVSSLAKGIYMVRFVKENGKDAAIQKLIIE